MFKIQLLLLLIAAVAIHGRPEGDPKKAETKREGKSQTVSSTPVDSASLPDAKNKDVNNFKRMAKEAHSFLNGGEIPVQLIYDPKDQETIAEVKEISPNGYKIEIRKRQSRSSDTFANVENPDFSKNKKDSALLGLSRLSKYLSKHGNKGETNKLAFTGMYDINLDLFNKALGIEARQHSDEGNEDSNEYYDISTDAQTYDIDNPIAMYIKHLTGAAEKNSNDNSFQNIKQLIQNYQAIHPSFGLMNYKFLPRLRAEIMKQLIADSILSLRDNSMYSQVPLIVSPYRLSNSFQDYLSLVNAKESGIVDLSSPSSSKKTSFLSFIEYEPQVEIRKRRSRSKRSTPQAGETNIPNSGTTGPQIMRLKVRRGGVAIAGPGGIATAGSGGTAIVGPGGTAYTSSDGIAVVGPGGKLIHVPGASYKSTPVVKARDGSVRLKSISPTSVVAGPVVYYPKNKRF